MVLFLTLSSLAELKMTVDIFIIKTLIQSESEESIYYLKYPFRLQTDSSVVLLPLNDAFYLFSLTNS